MNEPDPRVIKLVRELSETQQKLHAAERSAAVLRGLLQREKALRAAGVQPRQPEPEHRPSC